MTFTPKNRAAPTETPEMPTPDDDRLLEHQYDGIQEYDNPLPRWWVYIFWATIIFVPIYYFIPGTVGAGGKREEMYAAEMAAFKAEHPEPASGPVLTNEQVMAFVSNHEMVEHGKEIFGKNCAACHGPQGGGIIGPNLTDDAWIHGGQPVDIMNTVQKGVVAKGMPPWGTMLKPDDVNAVVAYVITLHGTKPANPKAPEGVVAPADAGAAPVAPAPPKTK
jgi:cytochrome c oxidase cbb3-type subunit 3